MSNINSLLNDLIFDPDFISLHRRAVSTSPIEVLNLKEDNKANILAWLLDPREGHLQGDYFLKMLVSAIYQNATDEQLEELPSSLTFNTISLSNMVVMREIVIKSKRRIDLLLADIASETIIVIERKDGSIATRGQLSNYYNWIQEHYSDWYQLFVLSDSQNKNHGKEIHESYVQLDDSWLSHALLELINKDGLPTRLEHSFRDIHDFVFGEWNERHDPFFVNFDDLHKKLANRHADTLRQLNQIPVDIGGEKYSLLSISPYDYFSQIIPNQTQYSHEEMELFSCLQANYYVINSLSYYSEFDLFSENIVHSYLELESIMKNNGICFFLEKHLTDKSDWSSYPYFMEVRRIEESEENQITYSIYFFASKCCQENGWHISEAFADLCELKRRKNWNLCAKLIEENITDVSLSNQIIRKIILDFIVKANQLHNL
ncbi:MAG: PD-(D/E)XK nuclease family protein [Thiotrichaceae bacterium]|nr:PD-(D/E)XK nuclease family protein [Thiotrichaceae bacterium]